MAPVTEVDPDTVSQLKSAIYLMVSKMVEQDLTHIDKDISATPTFVASLVELVYNQLLNLGEDLELFANHAGRSTIKPADLYMVTRKNDILTNVLKEYEETQIDK
ncbi:uncharacterized protein AC631_03268 [Debaryomyces fabryi]|uniref:MHF histone-fold complex subunit 1 n=1 Tax=Debaryomyces fabryi TaxID=58627 RepID=A0A0V1PXF6_9ASCO|nr:uncharacterized protein AC631_03268 [Debaryomyces fabryi]KSA00958.1 hypothetical protein AC631_03268 [Debaryomyces fabryi]CUM49793.1 unnamed protein product [Debaryomyces fabryi]